ncbi:MAG: alpha/beta fold hydrolase [Betaproteobacteria bacterium]
MKLESVLRYLAALPAALALTVLAGCASVGDGVAGKTNFRDQRYAHWVWWGADPDALTEALDRIRSSNAPREVAGYWDLQRDLGPGHWNFEFSALGQAAEARAQGVAASDPAAASKALHQASVYYGLAKYPYIRRDAGEVQAFQAQIRTYLRSWEVSGSPVEVVEVRWRNKMAKGLLHLPRNAGGNLPLVLAANGIDVFGAEFGPFARDMVDRGIAFFAFDLPGTGLNVEHTLDVDSEQLYLAFLDALLARGRFDASRVGVMGVSFGGNPAVKLAFTHPSRVAAVLNVCGPIHDVFNLPTDAIIRGIEPMYREVLFDRWKLRKGDNIALVETGRRFSLVRQGVIKPGVTTKVPIYNLNARGDYVATERDMELVARASADGVIAFSGADDHCPQDRKNAMPVAGRWLASKLAR